MLFYIRVPAGIPRLLLRQGFGRGGVRSLQRLAARSAGEPEGGPCRVAQGVELLSIWLVTSRKMGTDDAQTCTNPTGSFFKPTRELKQSKLLVNSFCVFFSFLLPAHRDSDPKTVCV